MASSTSMIRRRRVAPARRRRRRRWRRSRRTGWRRGRAWTESDRPDRPRGAERGAARRVPVRSGCVVARICAGDRRALDWATVATLATAVGTLVLAIATFAAVRSANRAARVAEAAYLVNLRPVLVTSRLEDPIRRSAGWTTTGPGSRAARRPPSSSTGPSIWRSRSATWARASPCRLAGRCDRAHSNDRGAARRPDDFRMQLRDLYVGPATSGSGRRRSGSRDDPDYGWLSQAITRRAAFTIELLYGDHDGGQRTITRFGMIPLPRRRRSAGSRPCPGTGTWTVRIPVEASPRDRGIGGSRARRR